VFAHSALLHGTLNGRLQVIDSESMQAKQEFAVFDGAIKQIEVSHDEEFIIVVGERVLRVLDRSYRVISQDLKGLLVHSFTRSLD
jgi:hypothetical protein